jgi:hypothetical protein
MLRTAKTLDEHTAIDLAKGFLEPRYPKVAYESQVNAERIAGKKRERQLAELIAFVASEGEPSDDLAKRFGLDEDHWCVRFFPVYEEGTASTIPPTTLRVYDSDGRVELHDM